MAATSDEALAKLEKLKRTRDALAKAKKDRAENRLYTYIPYAKQREFHAAGSKHSERLFMAGNQLGKTYAGAAEAAYHLTGLYPDWWEGRKWDRPVRMWVGGESSAAIRDTSQKLLFGDVASDRNNFGTGLLPKAALPDGGPNWSRGVDSVIDNCSVRHKSGGLSSILFKTYEQGRTKWQGDTIDLIWFDEEPPADVYSEGLTRFTARDGMAFVTFTPLKGMSTVVRRFLHDKSSERHVVRMRMDEAPHMTAEMMAKALARYPEHERGTRANGEVMAGEGRVFSVAESLVRVEPFAIPAYWKHILGLDLGHGQSETAHPTAAVWVAVDPDQDILYVYGTYRRKGGSIPEHASVLRSRGAIPVAWPHDALSADRASGKAVSQHYKEQGCAMLATHAQWADGSNSVWAGIVELQNRMESGRFKVFSTCADWFDEYRSYHMEDGKIVAIDDDLLSATRYAIMMRKYARVLEASLSWRPKATGQRVASGLDFNPLEV